MADNVHRKSHKQTSDRKISMPVHRTTTETIRLGEQADRGHQSLGLATQPVVNATANNQCRKKTSSFQITSVTVGTRMSNDAGDDSNDDLDESHTEDNSVEHSRVTDLDVETPSYSEDTFSKEDVFFNASNSALSTAPVIPTSSQYGLAIVPSEGNNPSNNTNDGNINSLDINSVTDNNIINLLSSNAKQDTDIREVHSHSRNERFKVVKIESTEPFKRGRWTCMDYLDHTSVNNPSNAINASKVSDPNEVCISYGITDGGVVVDTTKQNNLVVEDKPVMMDMNGHVTHQEVQHSMMTNPNAFLVGNTMLQNVQQLQQHNAHQMQPQVTAQIPQYFHQQMGSQQQQQQQQQQGATLPSNLQPIHSSNLGQPQSMPQVSIPIINQTNANIVPTQGMSHPKEEYITVGMQNQMMPGQNVCQTNVQQPSSTAAQPNILITQHPSQQQQQQQHPSQSQQPGHPQAQAQMSQISEPTMNPMMQQGIQNIHKVPQSAAPQQATATILGQQQQQSSPQPQIIPMPQQMQPQTSPGNPQQVQMSQVPTSCQTAAGGAPNTTMQQASMNFHQPETTEQDSVAASLLSAAAQQSADAILLESLTEVTQNNDDQHPLEDNESMSGTSAVAIDNKIEQAMDLVKSHLMFAVREEVEVLKEKIAELMDRINQLEAENLILKSHAAPEILAQLGGQTTTKLSQNNSGSGQ